MSRNVLSRALVSRDLVSRDLVSRDLMSRDLMSRDLMSRDLAGRTRVTVWSKLRILTSRGLPADPSRRFSGRPQKGLQQEVEALRLSGPVDL